MFQKLSRKLLKFQNHLRLVWFVEKFWSINDVGRVGWSLMNRTVPSSIKNVSIILTSQRWCCIPGFVGYSWFQRVVCPVIRLGFLWFDQFLLQSDSIISKFFVNLLIFWIFNFFGLNKSFHLSRFLFLKGKINKLENKTQNIHWTYAFE